MISNSLSKYLLLPLAVAAAFARQQYEEEQRELRLEQDGANLFVVGARSVKIWMFRKHAGHDEAKMLIEGFVFTQLLNRKNRVNRSGCFSYGGGLLVDVVGDSSMRDTFGFDESPCLACRWDFYIFAVDGAEAIYTFCLHNEGFSKLLLLFLGEDKLKH